MRGDSEYEDELFGYQGEGGGGGPGELFGYQVEGGGGGPGEEEEAGGLLVTTHTGQVCHCMGYQDPSSYPRPFFFRKFQLVKFYSWLKKITN